VKYFRRYLMDLDEMYDRSRILIPHETRALSVLVCGAGMGGSWVASALARMVSRVTIIDFDVVELVNVGVQAYTPHDVGSFKTDAVKHHNGGLNVTAIVGRMEISFFYAGSLSQYDVVVSCVDSMSGRQWLAEKCKADSVPLFVDGRTMGEMVCILTALNDAGQTGPTYERYLSTILPDEEVEEATCGAEGTVYSGMFFAVRAATVINNWARGITPKGKEVWSVSTMELLDGKDMTNANQETEVCLRCEEEEDYINNSQEKYGESYEEAITAASPDF
jgi:molybdopterin/thiamine biosynthesis adenylyltransferase